MVTDDAALEAIAAGPDGLLAGLAPGKVWVDMSTVSPGASSALAEQARALGAAMLDAPVSGSVHEAESGTLTIMVGGDDQAFAAVEPLLHELGSTVRHIGPTARACCSSSRSTSASPHRCSPSARAFCSPSAAASPASSPST